MNVNGLNINYLDYGNKKSKTIVLLHGWGQNVEMMDMVGKPFSDDFRIINIDLPGFGKSDVPSYAMNINDYATIIKELLNKLAVDKPILIGHSFGGRIAIKYASKNKVDKVILLSSPHKGHPKNGVKVKLLKQIKKIPGLKKIEIWAKNHIGSDDYKNASPIMKEILVNTVNENLSDDAKKIEVPTIIIFGSLDNQVPLEDVRELETLIPDAGLIVYDGCSHYAYLEKINQTISIIRKFIK
ncbi:MAG: alpha/beta hydrolase [Bacilli bacterium]